ncbi:MAG: hypothetical protein SOV63_03740 [Pyramidobacter porci]|uniref:hypothetical protein n=1 Tax=Pyramidobacter porci TaxID=2605789 RepID=UPI002A760D1E|nr:hypothetical protein [Pyramidobacter porci]MCI6260392.1 hypothetical protein [Pyramidobacter sp.]MDY2647900.1 hypothetical protein [Pyramidobacter porci]
MLGKSRAGGLFTNVEGPELKGSRPGDWAAGAGWPALTSPRLGDLFGMTDRRVRQLAQQGILPRDEKGRYPLRDCVLAYIAYLKSNPNESASVKELEYRKLKAETEERQAKADKAQLDLDERRGELISRADMYREWTGRCVELRAAMLGLPNELGFRFTADDTRALVEEVSEEFVRTTLETWSREGPFTPSAPSAVLDAARTEGADPAEED